MRPIEEHDLGAGLAGAIEDRGRDDRLARVERRGQRRHRVERQREQRVQPDPRRRHGTLGDGCLVLRAVERQFGLQHVEPRRVAAIEADLGRIARAPGEIAQLARRVPSGGGDVQPEVGAAHVVADLRHRRRQFGLAGADHRLAGRNAPSALASELEGHRHAEGLARRLFLELDRQLRVRMLAGGREPGRIDRTPEPGRGNHRVDEERAVDRRRQRQRLAWRRPARPRLGHPGLREAGVRRQQGQPPGGRHPPRRVRPPHQGSPHRSLIVVQAA